jgi:hypothetical protein
MAQSSWPFENIDTTETQYSQLFRTLNNGVNGTPDGGELEVDAAGAGLAVDIAAGQAMVRGHFYSSTEVETRSLATADATNDRIDLVVLRLDPVANTILLAVKTGVPDPAPVAPALVQTDGGIFEQPLANVLVPANAGVPSTITDRREFMGTKLGTWTTDGRPVPAGRVLFGFNTTLEAVEFYDPINEVWGPVAPEINSLDDIGDVTVTSVAEGDTLVYDGSDWVNTSQVSGDNLIYNGAMQVHQRGTSTAGLTDGSNGYYTADRWGFQEGGTPTWVFTQSVEADGPTGSGFTKSLKMACTTADASPAANQALIIAQTLEGQDLQGLKKGTADAESLTLSFWVKSDATGTYIVELRDQDNSRTISASYTVSSSGTWENKTVTFAGDTTGALDNDNNGSLALNFWLLSGADFASGSLQTSWGAISSADRAVGQTNLAAATSNYWQITGVQLEVGPVATPFEFKPFGQELAECQRYYYRLGADASGKDVGIGWNQTTTRLNIVVWFPVTLRTEPTALETSGTSSDYQVVYLGTSNIVSTGPTFVNSTVHSSRVSADTSGLTAGQAAGLRFLNTNAFLAWSAEL